MKKENEEHAFDAEKASTIIENENLKSTLRENFGAMLNESSDLPPEIENQFLANVIAFENAYHDAKKISVFDFIGKPEFKSVESLSDSEISSELERATELLSKHFLALDCICKYPDEVIYRFITEELFFKEIDDVRIAGFWFNFIYEEYYPNHEYDIKQRCEELIQVLFSNDWRYINSCFYDTILLNGKKYHRNNLDDFYGWFLDQWKTVTVEKTKAHKVLFDEAKGNVKFEVEITNEIQKTTEYLLFHFELIKEFDWWMINSMDLEIALYK